MAGTGAKLIITNQSTVSEDNIQTSCHISYLYWTYSKLSRIPNFSCEISTIRYLQMQGNDLNENADMTELEKHCQSALLKLGLNQNKFAIFPNLPMSVRKTLKSLWLTSNKI